MVYDKMINSEESYLYFSIKIHDLSDLSEMYAIINLEDENKGMAASQVIKIKLILFELTLYLYMTGRMFNANQCSLCLNDFNTRFAGNDIRYIIL